MSAYTESLSRTNLIYTAKIVASAMAIEYATHRVHVRVVRRGVVLRRSRRERSRVLLALLVPHFGLSVIFFGAYPLRVDAAHTADLPPLAAANHFARHILSAERLDEYVGGVVAGRHGDDAAVNVDPGRRRGAGVGERYSDKLTDAQESGGAYPEPPRPYDFTVVSREREPDANDPLAGGVEECLPETREEQSNGRTSTTLTIAKASS